MSSRHGPPSRARLMADASSVRMPARGERTPEYFGSLPMDCGLVVLVAGFPEDDALDVLFPALSPAPVWVWSGAERSGPARKAHSRAATRATSTEATSASSHPRLPS